jgi:transposase
VHPYLPGSPLRLRAHRRAFFEIPRTRGTNTTVLTSLHAQGMGPSMAVAGATIREVFETYVKHLLAPALRPGQLVVMDYLGANKPKRVRALIEDKGCELIYLPPYSPDFNPIEEAFSKVEHILRKIGARGSRHFRRAFHRRLRGWVHLRGRRTGACGRPDAK